MGCRSDCACSDSDGLRWAPSGPAVRAHFRNGASTLCGVCWVRRSRAAGFVPDRSAAWRTAATSGPTGGFVGGSTASFGATRTSPLDGSQQSASARAACLPGVVEERSRLERRPSSVTERRRPPKLRIQRMNDADGRRSARSTGPRLDVFSRPRFWRRGDRGGERRDPPGYVGTVECGGYDFMSEDD